MSYYDRLNTNVEKAVSAPPVHKAESLTSDGNIAHIQLADKLYTLRITRAGKLILTK
jgi:hemin uptake protein HemP